nr:DUF3997 domain-containing protein [Lysinibacillus timonensis]
MKQLLLMLSCLILTGCAGLADYTIPLDDGFRIDRLSAHQIAIYGEEPVRTENENFINYLYVPTKVTAVWWDHQFIVAKQLHLKTNERGIEKSPKNPTNDDYSYWIIEKETQEINGPMSQTELENETNRLFGKTIIFTPIGELNREY